MEMASSDSDVKATEAFADGDRGVRDSLAKDAADAHRQQGSMPPMEDINAYLAGILEGMDRKESDRKPLAATKKPGAMEKEFERRGGTEGAFGDWTIEKKEPTPQKLVQTPRDADYAKYWRLVRARLREIARKPEWRDRVQDAIGNPHALYGHLGKLEQERCLNRVRAILHEYQVKYGSALKRKPQRMHFS
jgi:hypothetical protein